MNSDGSFAFRSGYLKNGAPVLRSTNKVWTYLDSYTRDGCNFVQFSRKIRVCGEADNYIDIIGGTALVLYGYGMSQQLNTNDLGNQYSKMSRKFFMSVPLVATANVINDLSKYSDLETFDFISNVKTLIDLRFLNLLIISCWSFILLKVTIPSDSLTSYYCEMFKLPDSWMNTKRHLIRVKYFLSKV
jgi:hypothetical protein